MILMPCDLVRLWFRGRGKLLVEFAIMCSNISFRKQHAQTCHHPVTGRNSGQPCLWLCLLLSGQGPVKTSAVCPWCADHTGSVDDGMRRLRLDDWRTDYPGAVALKHQFRIE